MDVEVVFRVKWNNYSPVVVNSAAKSKSCLFCAYDMAEFHKDLSVRVTNNRRTRQNISLNFNCLIRVWSRYFNTNYIAIGFELLYEVLFYSFYLFSVEEFFNRNHVQNLHHSTCCGTVLAYS